ncbi:MAG TPA: porin family protein [Xanthobacteraceae bacterium]|nr:porin family protein [Xanthobacteraceae bacterium]
MRKAMVAAFVGFVVATGAAAAEPQFNWSGFYAGIDAGALSAQTPTTIPAIPVTADIKSSSFLGGAHIGYRWQVPASRWVTGIELDLWGARATDDAEFVGYGNSAQLEVKWGGSLRGVLGLSMDRMLVYATGGLAHARFNGCVLALGGGCWQSYSDSLWGWTAGLGAAYALHPNVIARLEYIYADFGEHSYSTPPINGGITDVGMRNHMLRAGVSWRFSSF